MALNKLRVGSLVVGSDPSSTIPAGFKLFGRRRDFQFQRSMGRGSMRLTAA
jgi:hypothetical protein